MKLIKKNKIELLNFYKKGNSISIKKSHKGQFTDYCGGKVTQKCIDKAKSSGNKKLIKQATFALNARKWKHAKGGIIKFLPGGVTPSNGRPVVYEAINGYFNQKGNNNFNPKDVLDQISGAIEPGYNAYKEQRDLNDYAKNAENQVFEANQKIAEKGLKQSDIINYANSGYNTGDILAKLKEDEENANDIMSGALKRRDKMRENLHNYKQEQREKTIVSGLTNLTKDLGNALDNSSNSISNPYLNDFAVSHINSQAVNEDGTLKDGYRKMPNGTITYFPIGNPPEDDNEGSINGNTGGTSNVGGNVGGSDNGSPSAGKNNSSKYPPSNNIIISNDGRIFEKGPDNMPTMGEWIKDENGNWILKK